MTVTFANTAKIDTEILSTSKQKPLGWKRYIDDIISTWNASSENVQMFIELANNHKKRKKVHG